MVGMLAQAALGSPLVEVCGSIDRRLLLVVVDNWFTRLEVGADDADAKGEPQRVSRVTLPFSGLVQERTSWTPIHWRPQKEFDLHFFVMRATEEVSISSVALAS
jgi:hypothetical protein